MTFLIGHAELWRTTNDPGNLLYSYIAIDGADPPKWPSGLNTTQPVPKAGDTFASQNNSLGLFAAMTAMDGLMIVFSFILLVGVQMVKILNKSGRRWPVFSTA